MDIDFYSNANDSSVLSNRQRLNGTHAPSRDIGEHLMSEAMRNQHQRNKSKANADLQDELDFTGPSN